MYKALSPSVLEEMEERGDIVVTIKNGWDQGVRWSTKPHNISYCIGTSLERIFTCYISKESATVQITNIEPTKLISANKGLIDAYMYVALKGLMKFAKELNTRRLIIDSYIPASADYMLDLGFSVTSKGLGSGARGCKTLED